MNASCLSGISAPCMRLCSISREDEGLTKLPREGLTPACSRRTADTALASSLSPEELEPILQPCLVYRIPVLVVGSSCGLVRKGCPPDRTTRRRQGVSSSATSFVSKSCLQTLQVLQSVATYFDRLVAGLSRWRCATKALLSFRKLQTSSCAGYSSASLERREVRYHFLFFFSLRNIR